MRNLSLIHILRDLVENIYTNEYLETLLPKWNSAIQEPDTFTQLPLQRDFYARNINCLLYTSSWRLESKADIDKYIDGLRETLEAQLTEDTIVNVEF